MKLTVGAVVEVVAVSEYAFGPPAPPGTRGTVVALPPEGVLGSAALIRWEATGEEQWLGSMEPVRIVGSAE